MNAKNSTARRVSAGVGVVALAAGLAITGAGAASAAPVQHSGEHGDWDITRTISDGTPKVGDTITVTNTFVLNRHITPIVKAYKDVHDTCLEYVDGSAKLATGNSGSATDEVSVGTPEVEPDYVRVDKQLAPSQVSFNTIKFSVDYRVGSECAGRTLDSTVHVAGNHGTNQTPQNFGPQITVQESSTGPGNGSGGDDNGSSNPGDDNGGAGEGAGGTGSLGFLGSLDLFGSLGLN